LEATQGRNYVKTRIQLLSGKHPSKGGEGDCVVKGGAKRDAFKFEPGLREKADVRGDRCGFVSLLIHSYKKDSIKKKRKLTRQTLF